MEKRMQIKFLKDVVGMIAGVQAAGIVDLLYSKKRVNEFLIAKKLNLNINQTRNILYKLSDEGLVSFEGKKDRKSGGWYTYYWTLDIAKALHSLRGSITRRIEELETQIATRQQARFYHCVNCDVELDEEQALLNNFACPECGEVLELREPTELVNELRKQIVKLQSELTLVDVELKTVTTKNASLKARAHKRAEKKKSDERKKARAARAAEKKASSKVVAKAKKRR